jgi:hypothetical protein
MKRLASRPKLQKPSDSSQPEKQYNNKHSKPLPLTLIQAMTTSM